MNEPFIPYDHNSYQKAQQIKDAIDKVQNVIDLVHLFVTDRSATEASALLVLNAVKVRAELKAKLDDLIFNNNQRKDPNHE